jgi:hypothetical protein
VLTRRAVLLAAAGYAASRGRKPPKRGRAHTLTFTDGAGMRSHVVLVGPPPTGGDGLTATPGDHEIDLSWDAVPGAATYRIERFNPYDVTQTRTLATQAGTTYLDSPDNYVLDNAPLWDGKGLILGAPYTYTVTPRTSGGSDMTGDVMTVTARPDDGISLSGWTEVRGSTRRDARNCGHYELTPNPTVVSAQTTLSGGETINDTQYEQTVLIGAQNTYTFNRCWLKGGIFNLMGETLCSTLIFNDCTLGPEVGHGASSSVYELGSFNANNAGKTTLRRCLVLHGGAQIMTHANGPNLIEDSFFTHLFSPLYTADPHLGVWSYGTGYGSEGQPHVFEVFRSHAEAGCRGMSDIGGPGGGPNIEIADCLLNGGSAHGTITCHTGMIFRRNRFKRAGVTNGQGFMEFGGASGNNPFNYNYGTPEIFTDNRWTDDNSLVAGGA